jgi:hypothetical protein
VSRAFSENGENAVQPESEEELARGEAWGRFWGIAASVTLPLVVLAWALYELWEAARN